MPKGTMCVAVILAVVLASSLLPTHLGSHSLIASRAGGISAANWLQSSYADFATGLRQDVESVPLGDGALHLLPSAIQGLFISAADVAPISFNALGVCWTAQLASAALLDVAVRTRASDGVWSSWRAIEEVDHDSTGRFCAGEPLSAQGGHAAQYRLFFRAAKQGTSPILEDITLTYIDSTSGPTAAEARQAALPISRAAAVAVPQPELIPRGAWGADENLRFDGGGHEIWPPEYQSVEKVIVHHTATENDGQDPAAWVRAIYYYHAVTKGWGDIGYNYLADRHGSIYEGRYGGPDVIAGHARPYNEGSMGISAIGTYGSAEGSVWPPASLMEGLASQVAWECARALVHPEGHSFFVETDLPNIAGHRECLVGGQSTTSCPGDYLFAELPGLRHQVWSRLEQSLPVHDARFLEHSTPHFMAAGETASVSLTVRNVGTLTWPQAGSAPVHLGYHWYDELGQQVVQPAEEDHRTPLEEDAPFGGEASLRSALLTAPHEPGTYRLEWDMVQEGVTWFESAGSAPLSVVVTVSGDPVPATCVDEIANGGFEWDGVWDRPSGPTAYSTARAHAGNRSMRVGILEPANNDGVWSSARQSVVIPSDATSATLRFWLYSQTGEPAATTPLSGSPLAGAARAAAPSEDAQYVLILDQHDQWIDTLLWQLSDDRQWTLHGEDGEYDLTQYAGQTIKVHFGVQNDGTDGVTAMYVDDVSLEICTTPDAPGQNDRFGLGFVSAADNLASEGRYQGAVAMGAHWDRWPLYWHWIDEGGYVGSHGDGTHDYDTLITQEIAHEITPIAILLGTADGRATAGSPHVPAPRVRNKVLPGQSMAPQGEASTAASPPVGLFEPIFSDGSDTPGPGKVINQENTWADFVHSTLERYKPGGILAMEQGWPDGVGIRHWEIWNEPDLDQFWTGTVGEYYRLLEVAYQSIEAADPEATVLLGGLAFYEKPSWLSDLLSLAGGEPAKAYFDVLSFHYYWSVYAGEDWMRQTRALLDAHLLADTPIWITESGVPVWDDYPATQLPVPPDSPWRGTMEEQAAYVIQNAALAFYLGAERNYHFMLHDDCGNDPTADAFGLRQNFTPHVCNPAHGKQRPSYTAYQLVAQQFRNLIPLWRQRTQDQDHIAFYRPEDESRVLALWATEGAPATATVSGTSEEGRLYWIESVLPPPDTTGISRTLTLVPTQGVYTLQLPAATNQNSDIPGDTAYYIGGRPYLLVERDTIPPSSSLDPLPPVSEVDIVLSWQGEDPGSGIASYDVWVSQDDDPLQLWTTTGATTLGLPGVTGHTYGFAIRARDRAGNEEPVPSAPQASTHVGSGVTISGPTMGEVSAAHTLIATVHSLDATPPITFTWEATEQAPITEISGLTHTVTFTWDTTARQAVTVTANDGEHTTTDTHTITIYTPSHLYLPAILRDG